MKKYKKILLIIICIIIVCWLAIFTTNYIRSNSLKTPVFAFAAETSDDGGSGTYYGLGYKVEVKKYVDAEYGVKVDSVRMFMFGKLISASIE